MKIRIVPILLAAAFIVLCACNVKTNTITTETPLLTERPTEAPTERPTPAPTVIPIDAPDFPELPKLGNLTDGALLTGDAAYIVFDGESDLKYVYDRFGELVDVFHAGSSGNNRWGRSAGIYGEHGVPYGYSIERREFLPNYCFTGGSAINMGVSKHYSYPMMPQDRYRVGYFVREILDASLENKIEFKDAPEYILDDPNSKPIKAYELDWKGGVVKLGEDYLLINRGDFGSEDYRGKEIIVIGPDGHEKERIATAKFGFIESCFAGKYLVAAQNPWEEDYNFNLYTLSGEIVKKNIMSVGAVGYTEMDDETYPLYACDYLIDRDGNILNKDLEKVGKVNPDEPDFSSIQSDACRQDELTPYLPMEIDGIELFIGDVYVGLKDAEGNWLFRIYNPRLSVDGDGIEVYW